MTRCGVPENEQQNAYLMGVAMKVAYELPIPSSKLEGGSLRQFYMNNHLDSVHELVSNANERKVLDCKCCVDMVYGIWTTRYNAAHCPEALNSCALLKLPLISPFKGEVVSGMSEEAIKAAAEIAK